VSWLPGQALDRTSAMNAMIVADLASDADLNERHHLWPFIQSWAAELGLTASTRSAGPPGPAPSTSSTTGNVNGPTPRRDNDSSVSPAPRPET
jgi:hypothetical protein